MRNVGIAVPVFNEEHAINGLLQSLANQTAIHDRYFIVLCDNGSTDRTIEKIVTFKKSRPNIAIEIVEEKTKGIPPARKHALDVAAALGAKYLVSLDADSEAPTDLVTHAENILSTSSYNVIKGKTLFPQRFQLILYIYFQKIMRVSYALSKLQTNIFGPNFFGPYFGLTKELYSSLYLGDIYNPLIPEEDFLLSRRCFCAGARFIPSQNAVRTSDRRFWGNQQLWMNHTREIDFRSTHHISHDVIPPTKDELDSAILRRKQKAADRILRTLVDIIFISSLTNEPFAKSKRVVKHAIQKLELPPSIFSHVQYHERYAYYQKFKNQYERHIMRTIDTYAR